MTRIIIDTDPGQDIDDLLAIHFALLRPELEVVAITTVTWPAADRARLVRRLLRHLGRQDIPVGAGMELPLRRVGAGELRSQQDRSATMNHACFAEPRDGRDDVHEDAAAVLARALESPGTPITLCCLAPLTNIACLLRRRPDLGARIAGINLMGGEVSLDRAEHNIAFDPVAADIVFSSGIPIRMGTWDITRRFVLDGEDLSRFAADGPPLHRALAEAIAAWHPAQSWKPGPVMYDIFPLICAFDRSCYELTDMAVQVIVSGERAGRTVPGAGERMLVTTGIDERRVRALYLDTVFAPA
jgi:purine nucleosidase/pyrimidine-specific ribonucleoside hydrolase